VSEAAWIIRPTGKVACKSLGICYIYIQKTKQKKTGKYHSEEKHV
jgi:hypothetical protein